MKSNFIDIIVIAIFAIKDILRQGEIVDSSCSQGAPILLKLPGRSDIICLF